MLKNGFRYSVAFLIVAPFIGASQLLGRVVGERKALNIIGPMVTRIAKLSLWISMPRIEAGEDFGVFAAKMKQTLSLWRTCFDVEVAAQNDDMLRLRVANCPFCEVLNALGQSRLSPYLCQGD
jgi:hypothetical protein